MFLKTYKEYNTMAKVSYASIVGSLIYAIMCIRLDFDYAVELVSKYQSNLGQMHGNVVKRI